MRDTEGHFTNDALTRNISASGVLFTANSQVELGGPIDYVVTLTNVEGVEVELRCTGKVVRMEKTAQPASPDFLIAATLDRYQFIRHNS